MGLRATLNFRKFKVALNLKYRFFLKFAKSYVSLKTSITPPVKWEGVSLLNNFKCEESGMRAWRAFMWVQGS